MAASNHLQTLSPPRSPPRWLAVGLFLLTLIGPLASGWLTLAGCDPFAINGGATRFFTGLFSGLAFAILGFLIFVYQPHNRIGWLCLITGFSLHADSATDLYIQCGLTGTITAAGMPYAAWLLYATGGAAIIPLQVLLPMMFPTGRFLSYRWRWVTIIGIVISLGAAAALGLMPDLSQDNGFETRFPVTNPFGVTNLPDWWFPFFRTISVGLVLLLILLGLISMIVRFRRAAGDERQQIKWLVCYLATGIGIQIFLLEIPATFFYPQLWDTVWYAIVLPLVFVGIPIVMGIAIFKYRLYAIDLVINRTLVYGGLTLVVVLIYTLTVGGLSLMFQSAGSLPISLIATALIAIAFQPAREYLQRSINRLMFGQRDDPYAVLSHLSQQLQTTAVPTETLTSIVETIAGTLKLPYAAIELLEQTEQIGQATVGEPVAEVVELPLRYQNETVGRLLVSPRAPGETFTAKEQKLLADIAAQTGSVASATRLTLALQRSRERLVLAREEERRRIRRDLHDGLGPTLASQTLKLDAILDLLTADPDAAGQHVKQLKQQTQQMVADIRRLVYELRPPALDELGLLEALRAHVAQMGGLNGQLHIAIEAAPEPLPPLPAAIEVAAYRIALEGVTNVIRHAQAKQCRVRFAITPGQPLPGLVITITDDGRGLPPGFRSGVGLTSMRERAEELGGTCMVGAGQNGGTQVRAMLSFSLSS